MEVSHQRCCGLDVHKKSVVACLLQSEGEGPATKETRTFGTTTRELLRLADWLGAVGCTQVAMESTGSYWHPVYNILEDRFSLVVVNTRHVKQVPGRKTDVKDAEWIADLLRHGLLKASFIPDRADRELRELLRYRTSLVWERASEINRVQKVLEGANIKLAAVVTNVLGVSGRAMLSALVAGNDDPAALAQLARGRMRPKTADLEAALDGAVRPHQRFMLEAQLRHVDDLDQLIDRVTTEIAERVRPAEAELQRLETIPGVGRRTAEIVIGEIGTDMSRFPSAGHLASWAGLCPGLNESAGKNRSGRTPRGSPWIKRALVQSAHATARSHTYLGSQYRRLAVRIGARKAAVAVAHSILVIAYNLLRNGTVYGELGSDESAERDRERSRQRLTTRLEQLGYRVTVQAAV